MTFELVYLEWVDASAIHGWQSLDDIQRDGAPLVIQSVGWIVHETDDAITLVAHMHKDNPNAVRQMSDPLTIPKGIIRERRTMRKR